MRILASSFVYTHFLQFLMIHASLLLKCRRTRGAKLLHWQSFASAFVCRLFKTSHSGKLKSKEHGRVIPSMVLREEEELRHLGYVGAKHPFVESQLAEHDHSCIWSGFLGRLVLWL